ncbi:MAG: hypothetical protein ACOCRL_01945 [Bacillota bacterium]
MRKFVLLYLIVFLVMSLLLGCNIGDVISPENEEEYVFETYSKDPFFSVQCPGQWEIQKVDINSDTMQLYFIQENENTFPKFHVFIDDFLKYTDMYPGDILEFYDDNYTDFIPLLEDIYKESFARSTGYNINEFNFEIIMKKEHIELNGHKAIKSVFEIIHEQGEEYKLTVIHPEAMGLTYSFAYIDEKDNFNNSQKLQEKIFDSLEYGFDIWEY